MCIIFFYRRRVKRNGGFRAFRQEAVGVFPHFIVFLSGGSSCQEVPGRMRPGSVYYTRQGAGTSSAPDAGSAGAVFRPAFYFCLRLRAVSSQKRFAALKKSSPLQGCPVRASGKGEFFQPRGAFFQISFSFSSSGTSCVRSGITRHAPACRSCSPGVLVCTAAQRMPARAAA